MAAPSKAEILGVKPGRLSKYSIRRIERATEALTELAIAWSEIDLAVDFDVTELVEQIDKFRKGTLKESLELLKEPFEDTDG